MQSETKVCQNCKQSFTIDPADFDFYKKMSVPAPTFCPQCRLIRRLSWRNERSLHKRTCARCKKSIISIFAPDTPMNIYCSACWWGDTWGGLEYGVDFDPTRPFLLQLKELLQRVPIMQLYSIYSTLVNSEYVNMSAYCKNCYLTTYSDRNEDCAYGSFIVDSSDCLDNLMLKECEFTYESVNCQYCYQTFYSTDCESCHNVSFSLNCVGCTDCFGCVNLRNKQYHIFNQQYTKAEYEKKLAELRVDTVKDRDAMYGRVRKLWKQFPQKYMHARQNTDVSGDYVFNSKNVKDSYIVLGGEDSRYCSFVEKIKDSYDCTNYFLDSELMYDSIQSGGPGTRIAFGWWVIDSNRDVQYSMFTIGSSNMFGCVGMKKKEYCILNKQYTKEEYGKLRAQIIAQMNDMPYTDSLGNTYRYGEFFPTELSPFGYNETTAQEFFPLTQPEAKTKGYNWKEDQEKNYKATLPAESVPATIVETKDDILKEIIACAHAGTCPDQCSKVFRIIPAELQFYRRFNIPVPTLCPQCRHCRRLAERNPIILYARACECEGKASRGGTYKNLGSHVHGVGHCPNTFKTSYGSNRPEIIYCESCYNAEVV